MLVWLVTLAPLFGLQEAEPKRAPVRHPNLLLTREEIEQVKLKVKEQAWAAKLLDRVKEKAEKENATLEAALAYVLAGDPKYLRIAREHLLSDAKGQMSHYEKIDVKAEPEWGRWNHWGSVAWAYDLVFEALTAQERDQIERWLRTAARTMIEQENVLSTTANLVFCQHWRVGMIGYCLGDPVLIDYGLRDPGCHGPSKGGFYPVLDTMIRDERFWAEAPIYALHYDLHGMFALAEAALRYDGTDLYRYVSPKSGASLKKLVDGYLAMAFSMEKGGLIRLATFGDGSTSCALSGQLEDTFMDGSFMAVLEVAYKRYKEEGYAWVLSLDPERASFIRRGRPAFSYVALTHGELLPERPAPPTAPCGLYPSMGFAMIRSDESPGFWTSGALSAVVRLGNRIGHGHEDYFSLILHGQGRLLYPDLNVIQYEPRWLNWTAEGIGHSTLLIDHESPAPGAFETRHDFAPEVKFFAVEGSSFERSTQSRSLFMTDSYVADVFRAADTDGHERTFDWVVHGLGRLYPGEPRAYRKSDDLVPFYGWVEHEKSRSTDGGWQADWIQGDSGIRLTVTGAPGTRVYAGEGPLVDGPPHARLDGHPEPSLPLVLARRRAATTTFAAVHEPYMGRPRIKSVSLLAETDAGIAVGVDSDRLLLGWGPKHVLLRGGEEAFQFTGHAFVRVGPEVIARGEISGLRVRGSSLRLNGKKVPVAVKGEFLVYGDVPEGAGAPPAGLQAKPSLHGFFLPEEVRLKAGSEREVSLTLRAVGGDLKETLRFSPPEGITVDPPAVDLELVEGTTQTVSLRVRAREGMPEGLSEIRLDPLGETLPVSVGLVLRKDRRFPRLAQWVARAPRYTMMVDEFSGVGTYLLDGDGHRRTGRLGSGNFIYGFGALQRGNDWIFRQQQACQQVWSSKDSLTLLGEGRLNFTFREDRVVVKYNLPTRADQEHTMWLGNFDALEAPVHNGTQRVPYEPVVAEWLFFPHPVYRQGVLLRFQKKTPVTLCGQTAVHFPVRSGDEVSISFATRDELCQAAIDAAAPGSVVDLPPGRFELRSALALRSNLTVRGNRTVLVPCDGKQVRLAADAKAGSREIFLSEALPVGSGIVLRDDRTSGFAITTTTLAQALGGNAYRVSEPLVHDYSVDRKATATVAFPVVSVRNVKDVTLEGLAIDGNRAGASTPMDGCRGGGIYLYESERVTIRNCSVRDYRGDGLSVQWKSKDVVVEDCLAEKNSGFGLHPGSDSNGCSFRRNKSIGNGGPGLFVCVAVHHCRFESNEIRENAGEGISIGERDTDNIFVGNEVISNGRSGVLFRGDTKGEDLEPHRNVFEKNKILDNGAGIVIRGSPRDLVFRDNLER
ncbi:MAG TPA: right-handed parallel beta-helix repeat-containing protein [Planctomycetota bacterium]|nr:right-handed parallel beta-helix repeat-containing protein [Planctomycetota bacterium]